MKVSLFLVELTPIRYRPFLPRGRLVVDNQSRRRLRVSLLLENFSDTRASLGLHVTLTCSLVLISSQRISKQRKKLLAIKSRRAFVKHKQTKKQRKKLTTFNYKVQTAPGDQFVGE